ncbi:hypothetical protein ANO11243_051870 [Dothideomycetidae sp. 11243]|nr:hypothetical protein ANO11243_051870 [fungal sp. No.11243]
MPTTTTHKLFPAAPIHLPSDLSESQLLSFPAFQTWAKALHHNLSLQSNPSHPFHSSPYSLKSITIQSVDFFGNNKPGFIKLQSSISNSSGSSLPGSVLLRGGSTAILVLLQPSDAQDKDEIYTILTRQPRIPAASLDFAELPAGMLDDSGAFAGKAAKELEEETALTIDADEVVDLTAAALEGTEGEEDLKRAVYPSAGGCDEFVPLFACRKRLPRTEMEELKGKLSGLREEGEMITLKIVKLKDLWREGARDAKALSALALYEGLQREGKLEGLFEKGKGAKM